MSYQIGLDTLHLRPTPRLAHTEYFDHEPLARHIVGAEPQNFRRAMQDAWEYDFIWSTNDGPTPWAQRGRVTDMGHAVYVADGSDFRPPQTCPFTSEADVWAFDAVEEYGLPDFAELVQFYRQLHQERQQLQPNCIVPGGYYKTIISGAIDAFGWDALLLAAIDLRKFEQVLDSFFRLTLHHVKAWAQTDIVAFIQHDDFVWSSGPFMDPAFYRQAIIPRYAELWKVLHAAGKKVLFCSDANWEMFVADIAAAGADGFIFEPMLPLEPVVRDFGQTHVIVGSKVDCRTMTYGTHDDIAREIDQTLELAADCPGFMFAVGNHIPADVPIAAGLFYFEHLRNHWQRRAPQPQR